MAESEIPDFLAKQQEILEQFLRDRQLLDVRIAKQEQLVAALKSVAEPDVDTASTIGFTDAVRKALQSASDQTVSPMEIRERMLMTGFKLNTYAQPLATIHVVLKRLVKSGEAQEVGDSENRRYWWALYGEPPALLASHRAVRVKRQKGVASSGRSEDGKRRLK